jgi:hypothetical protein
MLINWIIEALKWGLLVAPVERVGLARSFAATIAGTSIALVTPNRTGEFVGRVLFLKPENRWQAGFATVLGSMAQFAVTLIGGCVMLAAGSLLDRPIGVQPVAERVLLWSAMAIAVAAAFLFFRPDVLKRSFAALPVLRRFEARMAVLEHFGTRTLLIVFALSLARYAVFTVQFCLLLAVLAHTPFRAAVIAVPQVFLFTTLVPTTMLSEIAVRGSVATTLIDGPTIGVLLATTALWFINLVVPALAGSVLLLVSRIRTKNDLQ